MVMPSESTEHIENGKSGEQVSRTLVSVVAVVCTLPRTRCRRARRCAIVWPVGVNLNARIGSGSLLWCSDFGHRWLLDHGQRHMAGDGVRTVRASHEAMVIIQDSFLDDPKILIY